MKKDGLLRQPIACYEIAMRTYDFVLTYVGNRTINMTLVMLLLVGLMFLTSVHWGIRLDIIFYFITSKYENHPK